MDRPLTAEEQAAFDDFVKSIQENVADIFAANPALTSLIGENRTVTMVDIQALWAKVDFEIVDNNHVFQNGSARGEADWNNGNPVVRFAIGHILNADRADDATRQNDPQHQDSIMRFQSLNDVGHLTELGRDYHVGAGTAYDPRIAEQIANGVAMSLQSLFGDGVYVDPNNGVLPLWQGFTP